VLAAAADDPRESRAHLHIEAVFAPFAWACG
jgi:hypothetical protein